MKYLIEIHHGIGDVVQITGIIESIKKSEPDAYIALILNKDAYKTLFKNDCRVDKFYKIDLVEMSNKEIVNVLREMRSEKFDYFLASPISNQKAIHVLAMMSGAKFIYGEQFAKISKLFKRYKATEKKDTEHIVKRNENVLRSMGKNFETNYPCLKCDKEHVIDIPCNSVAICIGTSIPQKTWPLEKYIQVAEFFENRGYHIVLLGGGKEQEQYSLYEKEHFTWMNLMGKLSLIESATAAGKCELVIGGDTGVMHMAAAVGATTLTLFSCTDPLLHAPYSNQSFYYTVKTDCQYCYEKGIVRQCKNYECLNAIEVQDVIAVAESILLKTDKKEEYRFIIE